MIRQIDNRQFCGHAHALRVEQIIGTDTQIKQMTRRNPRRVVVVISGTWRRNPQTGRAETGLVTRCDRVSDGGSLAATEESNGSLLSGGQCERRLKIRYRAGDQAAVVSPGESEPGTIVRPLVTEVRCLLKCLIMIDAEDTCFHGRIKDQAAVRWTEISRAVMPDRGVGLKAVQVWCTEPDRYAVDFGLAPRDGKLDRRIE